MTGALLGALLAGGILLTVAGASAVRSPRLANRVRANSTRGGDRRPLSPLGVLLTLAPRVQRDQARIADRRARAGRSQNPAHHVLEQLGWAGGGLVAGLVFGLLVRSTGAALVMATLGALAGVVLHDRRLSSAARRRGRRMSSELPPIADLLAFAVAAGQPPLQALDRLSSVVSGELPDEIAQAVSDVRVGTSFNAALRSLAARVPSSDVQRFVDGIIVATDRGTPLAEVLRAQAQDARAAGRRGLLELAGRREVAMLVPVVFLILPIVVVIALFPGLHSLTLSVP